MLFVCDLLFFRVGATLAVVPSPTINGEHSTMFPLPQENRKRTRRDTPPGVSGPHYKQEDPVGFSVSLRGAKRRGNLLVLPS